MRQCFPVTPAETEEFKTSVEGQVGIPARLTISSEWSIEDVYSDRPLVEVSLEDVGDLLQDPDPRTVSLPK